MSAQIQQQVQLVQPNLATYQNNFKLAQLSSPTGLLGMTKAALLEIIHDNPRWFECN
jgi:hypothetical protein